MYTLCVSILLYFPIFLFSYMHMHTYTFTHIPICSLRTRVYRVEINLEDMSVSPPVLVYNHTASTYAGPFTIALSSSLCHLIPGSCIVIMYYAPVSPKRKCTHILFYKPKFL